METATATVDLACARLTAGLRAGLPTAAAIGLAFLLAGCRGPGWARLEPAMGGPPADTVVFASASAHFLTAPDARHPDRPGVLFAEVEHRPARNGPATTWRLMACLEPGDSPGHVRVTALVGRVERERVPIWRLYVSQQPVECWQFDQRLMLDGLIEPAERLNPHDAGDWRLSACLKPAAGRGGFTKGLDRILAELAKMRAGVASAPSPGELAAIDEAVGRLTKMVPGKSVKASRPKRAAGKAASSRPADRPG